MAFTASALKWVERGALPDAVVRAGIRHLVRERSRDIRVVGTEAGEQRTRDFAAAMVASPVAVLTDKANEQHYEVPAEFFALMLGPHRKYSSGWWPDGVTTLAEAEKAALRQTCEHAQLADGQRIVELGCGWGSLSLWMAEHYPNSSILAVSNSNSQREYILAQARQRGLVNLQLQVVDMNHFRMPGDVDRIVSVEMFEHMRNWPELFLRVSRALRDDGRFFMHVFCHRAVPYLFEDQDASDWMSRYFFSGGMMPSESLAVQFQRDLALRQQWRWSGVHYQRTARAWLSNLDRNRIAARAILETVYGSEQSALWMQRWRMFLMACEELFGYRRGEEWCVSHYLFEKRRGE
ncbi:MAG: cyclopropane-fatty-acyl-phospholipid synthase family protein [Steroidobacteraceae bacterium]